MAEDRGRCHVTKPRGSSLSQSTFCPPNVCTPGARLGAPGARLEHARGPPGTRPDPKPGAQAIPTPCGPKTDEIKWSMRHEIFLRLYFYIGRRGHHYIRSVGAGRHALSILFLRAYSFEIGTKMLHFAAVGGLSFLFSVVLAMGHEWSTVRICILGWFWDGKCVPRP